MKVLALTNLFPRADRRAYGTFNRDMLLALSRYCQVRVVAPAPVWTMLGTPRDLVSPRRERASGIDAVFPAFYSLPGVPLLHASGMALSLRATMRRVHEEYPWDVLLAAWAYPDAVAGAHLAKWWDTPLVTVTLGNDLHVLPSYLGIRPQIQWALSRSARVVAVSPSLAARAIELGAPQDRVVHHDAGEALSWDEVGKRYFRMLKEVLREWRLDRAAVMDAYSDQDDG